MMKRVLTLLAAMGVAVVLASGLVLVAGLEPSGVSRAEAQSSVTNNREDINQQARQVSLSGVFHVTWGDPPPNSNAKAKTEYVLTDNQGQEKELLLDESVANPAGGPLAFNGKRVNLEGTRVADKPNHLKIRSIQFERSKDAAKAKLRVESGEFASQALVNGSKPFATIGCRFADSTNVTPHDQAWFERLMSNTEPGMDHFWRQLSYNKVNLTGSQTRAWYNLPQQRSAYFDASGNANLTLLAQDCTAAADADFFFPSFYGINLMFNQALDCCAWGGGRTLTRDGQTKYYSMTWMPMVSPYNKHKDLAHEMGHAFGLPHSSGPYDWEYDSVWDPMSNGGICLAESQPEFGCQGNHTIAFHKDMLGWIPSTRKYTATSGTDQKVTIERLGVPTSTANYLMAQVPIGTSKTQFYTVEARRFAGYDGLYAGYDSVGHIPGEAIVIHKVDTTREDRLAQVVDPDNNRDPNDAGAMWLPGERFTDNVNNISIQIAGATPSGYTVRIIKK